ncbi:hypothetical protein KA005_29160 [bacterium]|nr:hypothetical protein [bacterium]
MAVFGGKVVGKAALATFGKRLGQKAADKALNLLASKYSPEKKQAVLLDGSQLVYMKADSNTYNAFIYPKQNKINWDVLLRQEHSSMSAYQRESLNMSMQFLNNLMQAQTTEMHKQKKAMEMLLPMLSQLFTIEMTNQQADLQKLSAIMNSLSSVSTEQLNVTNPSESSARNWYKKGVALWNPSIYGYTRPSLAIEYFSRALRLDPVNANTYSSRGIAYQQIRDYTAAVEDFSHAISLSIPPYIAENYNHRGSAYYMMQQFGKASVDFENACSMGDKRGCANYHKYFK